MAICPRCSTRYPETAQVCESDGETLVPGDVVLDADLPAGTVVGEFRVEHKLGEGGFGAVYRAVHPLIGKAAAVKVLNREYSSNPEMVSRFIAEARAVNQIRHRNIVDIFLFGQLPDGRQYFVMELLDGVPLDQHVRNRGRLAPEEALPIFRGVARALAAAHTAGIIHRDLKPENVFLVDDGEGGFVAKLIDFGIAKLLGETGGASHKTQTGAMMGTAYFMSPEQCRGRNVDHRTDIYAFGAMVHVVLTGMRPFDGESYMDVVMKQITEAPPKLSEVCPDLPAALDSVVARLLAKKPEDRPQTAAQAFAELEAVIPRDAGGRPSGAVSIVPAGPSPSSAPALVEARTLASDARAPRPFSFDGAASGPKPRRADARSPATDLARAPSAGTFGPSVQDTPDPQQSLASATGSTAAPRRPPLFVMVGAALLAAAAGAFLVLRVSSGPDPSANAATASAVIVPAPGPATSAVPTGTVEVAPAPIPTAVVIAADAGAPDASSSKTPSPSPSASASTKASAAPGARKTTRGGNATDLDF